MTHEIITELALNSGLLYFVGFFVLVLVYVLRPANRAKFERAAKVPLENDEG
jgi:cytochrome c oxidase cbb3-type subunit IV